MATFKEMVDEVTLRLSGFGMRNDATAYLSSGSGITSSATSFLITTTSPVGRGVIEIDDELIWIDSYDKTTGSVTVPPWGRGYMGTTATSHAGYAKVSVNPTYTRRAIKNEINNTIRAMSASLFSVGQATFTYNPVVTTYAVPSEANSIIAVKYQTIGPTKEWQQLRKWRFDTTADISTFGSPNTITLYQPAQPGATIMVAYAYDPATLSNDLDDFESTTGLIAACQDVVTLGACHRILSFIDSGRLSFDSPEADIQSGKIQMGSGTNVAKYVFALYNQRLTEETLRQQKLYPIRTHYTA